MIQFMEQYDYVKDYNTLIIIWTTYYFEGLQAKKAYTLKTM